MRRVAYTDTVLDRRYATLIDILLASLQVRVPGKLMAGLVGILVVEKGIGSPVCLIVGVLGKEPSRYGILDILWREGEGRSLLKSHLLAELRIQRTELKSERPLLVVRPWLGDDRSKDVDR